MKWVFGDVGPGMLVGDDRSWVSRAAVSLLRGMGLRESPLTHHARSSDHAFSAHFECPPGATVPIRLESLTAEEMCESVRNCTKSNAPPSLGDGHHDDDPRMMVGLCPRYVTDASQPPDLREGQKEYTDRVLSTPLVWEEPGCYFFECTKAGVFLWSADGGRYGNKVLDNCLVERSPGTYQAEVNFSCGSDGTKPYLQLVAEGTSYRWSINGPICKGGVFSPTASVAPSCPVASGDLVPTVTFLTANCRAALL